MYSIKIVLLFLKIHCTELFPNLIFVRLPKKICQNITKDTFLLEKKYQRFYYEATLRLRAFRQVKIVGGEVSLSKRVLVISNLLGSTDRFLRDTSFRLPCKSQCSARWTKGPYRLLCEMLSGLFKGANSFLYSLQPWCGPPDFLLFPRLKTPMKEHHFDTVDKLKQAWTKVLKDISEVAYRDTFNAWKSRWKRCIDAGV